MCGSCATDDCLVAISKGRLAAGDILERRLGIHIRKAMDLSTLAGFDRAVAALAGQLRSSAAQSDDGAVRAAVAVLDVDWHATTAAERRKLVSRALVAAGRKTALVPAAVRLAFGDAAGKVVDGARALVRNRQGLNIAADFNAIDQRIVRHLATSQAGFVRDEYGRRHAAFSAQAGRIVADGLEAGLGREDIAGDLHAAARDTLAGRSDFYWEVVAGSFVSQGDTPATQIPALRNSLG